LPELKIEESDKHEDEEDYSMMDNILQNVQIVNQIHSISNFESPLKMFQHAQQNLLESGNATTYSVLKVHDGDPFIKQEDDIETQDEFHKLWRSNLIYPIFMIINIETFILEQLLKTNHSF
jgi:hypothetical protein